MRKILREKISVLMFLQSREIFTFLYICFAYDRDCDFIVMWVLPYFPIFFVMQELNADKGYIFAWILDVSKS